MPRAFVSKMRWSLEGRVQRGPRAIISFETSPDVFRLYEDAFVALGA